MVSVPSGDSSSSSCMGVYVDEIIQEHIHTPHKLIIIIITVHILDAYWIACYSLIHTHAHGTYHATAWTSGKTKLMENRFGAPCRISITGQENAYIFGKLPPVFKACCFRLAA